MRARLATLALTSAVASAGCSDTQTLIRIERQPTTLAAATDDGWVAGGAVLVGGPGTFSFPQPLALRISLIDPEAAPPAEGEEPPPPRLVSIATLTLFGTAAAEITDGIVCQPTYCEAELSVLQSGTTMLQITAKNPDADRRDCFYYAVYEDADPAGAGTALREQVEAQQRDCEAKLFD